MPPQETDMDEAATLIVAWRTGRNAHGRLVRAGGDVIDALRGNAKRALTTLSIGESRPYNPDDEQDEDCPALTTDRSELLDTALVGEIVRGSSLSIITSNDLRKRAIALYALLIGNDSDSRIIFVRRGNPVSLAKKSVVAMFDEALTRVTEPILAFDPSFDVIIHENSVWVLNQKNFEALFKESEAVLAKTSEWVDSLASHLPIDDDSKEWLSKRLRQNSVMRRKVQSILRRSYIPTLNAEILTQKMADHGMEPDSLMIDGHLIFNKDTEKNILLLLNEDLWTGDFSGDHYAAARKAARP